MAVGHATTSEYEPNWPWLWALSKFWVCTVFLDTLVSIVYLPIISRGLQYVFPDIGMRLYKVAGFGFLQHYTLTYRISLADVFTIVPLILVWLAWRLLLELYLWPEVFAHRFRRSDLDRIKSLVVTMGSIVIIGDACLFAAAFSLASWGGGKFSIAAVIAAAFYTTVVGFSTFVSLHLADAANSLKKKGN
jgi:hypothetical protein